jgi:hypoxanthine phosphoribosyltransferase
MTLTVSLDAVQVLFSKQQIDAKLDLIAEQISNDYQGSSNLVIVGVLKGSVIFTADLIRRLRVPCELEFIRLSSYNGGTESSGKVKVYDLSLPDLHNKEILIIEDIVDSGRTGQFLLNFFKNQVEAKSVKLVALIDKPCKRQEEFADIRPDYCCFTIDDHFVLGYGLDYNQQFRYLPYIGYIENLK